MTSAEIRQSYLNFFKEKGHTIVPSSSLMPDAPNLLFTNAGMNQFVPIFLGEQKCPYRPARAADTQKCIRAGGKHNDLEDVGLDTYHHTFFEMLGNWSFGDYFKKEAIEWAWELITGVWGFPKNRLYATVYMPDKEAGDPSEFDQEAYDFWETIFVGAGLDPKVHIVYGNKKDNFWMMGDTGPCGPCSELHIDLTQNGDTQGALVNKDSSECIEIWNLVFIQFNANPDGSFSPLAAKHVDTGMGFERVVAALQCTKDFKNFGVTISNYDTDVFRPIFTELERLSGHIYKSTLPQSGTTGASDQEKIDVAFRVIADHLRTLSFSIADGIQPGNTDRNYVLRRILRRAVRYGRSLGLREPFFFKLVDVLVTQMGAFFPELSARKKTIESVIQTEEEAFNRTLDRGIDLFNEEVDSLTQGDRLSGDFAFKLYDTYGFPLDLTQLMARERGLSVGQERFDELMDQQRARARAARKQEIISVSEQNSDATTAFVGFDQLTCESQVVDVVDVAGQAGIIVETSPFYAEMGGQVGDTGILSAGGSVWKVGDTKKVKNAFVHVLEQGDAPSKGAAVSLTVDLARRLTIQRHHTATHLLHWALHEVVSREATQKGSYVGTDKLTFDFNANGLTPSQLADIERLVNERILEDEPLSWTEMPMDEVMKRNDIIHLFGEKYGETVRVVQIGGEAGSLDGYSMELCGGTHAAATGEIGLFRITSESAVAAGIRRIEATAGHLAYGRAVEESALIQRLAGNLNCPLGEVESKLEALQKQAKNLEKELRGLKQKQAAHEARGLLEKAEEAGGIRFIRKHLPGLDGNALQAIADSLKGEFEGVLVLLGEEGSNVAIVVSVSASLTNQVQAGRIVKELAPLIGGKGGGRPENARGGGKDPSGISVALAKLPALLGG